MLNKTLPHTFISQVESILDHGATITQKFQTLADRWTMFTETENQAQGQLNAAISNPETTAEELARLHTLAVAELLANPINKATVRNEAGAHLLALLRKEYATVANANYETIRAAFNAQATKLTAALDLADPEARPEEMVMASAKVRNAWAEAPVLALELTALLGTLHTAALLAGKAEPMGHHDQCLIGLSTDTTGLHRRRVWEAWGTTSGRAGRWRELWKLGATLEAPTLEDAKSYREPKPMEIRAERKNLGIVQFEYDPEDATHDRIKDQLHKEAIAVGIHPLDYTDDGSSAVHAH